MQLYKHQEEVLEATKDKNRVAYYLDMGLGKTYVGSEKLIDLRKTNNLVICQKSKIKDWIDHFKSNYSEKQYLIEVFDLTKKQEFERFISLCKHENDELNPCQFIGIINYDLIFRRKELLGLCDFTLMLDESSCIQNETSKRSKAILKMNPENVILLSGTPTSGKYEKLYSQLQLLGWKISKKLYWTQYVDVEKIDMDGFIIQKVIGYKNVDRLKNKLKSHGAVFMKTNEVLNLPEQIHNEVLVDTTKEYRYFKKHSIITVTDLGYYFEDDSDFYGKDVSPRYELVGDASLTKRLYMRMMASGFNRNKIAALKDLIESTEDRLIIFYNFTQELKQIKNLAKSCGNRPISIINGEIKDLTSYDNEKNSITIIQYQAGSMGLNLQKANKIIYFSLTERSELFEQSKKRTHRIGQKNSCIYYYLITKNSIDEDIYENLKLGRDYNDELFKKKYT